MSLLRWNCFFGVEKRRIRKFGPKANLQSDFLRNNPATVRLPSPFPPYLALPSSPCFLNIKRAPFSFLSPSLPSLFPLPDAIRCHLESHTPGRRRSSFYSTVIQSIILRSRSLSATVWRIIPRRRNRRHL